MHQRYRRDLGDTSGDYVTPSSQPGISRQRSLPTRLWLRSVVSPVCPPCPYSHAEYESLTWRTKLVSQHLGVMTSSPAHQVSITVSAFVQRFSSTPRGVRLARHLAVHRLDAWGIPYDFEALDVAALLVTEPAASAVTHGRPSGGIRRSAVARSA